MRSENEKTSTQRRRERRDFGDTFYVVVFALSAGLGANSFAAEKAKEWKPPENPMDDLHWYPEIPQNKPALDTLTNGGFEEADEAKKGYPLHPRGWAHPDGFTIQWKTDSDPAHGKVIVLDTDVLETEAKARQAAMRDAAANGT